jgi:hypothetical protein
MIAAYTPESPPMSTGAPTTIQIFAIVAVVAFAAGTVGLVLQAVRGTRGPSFLESAASMMFVGWFSTAVALQLAGVSWTSGGVVALPWLAVIPLVVASLALVAVGIRVDRTARPAVGGRNDGA